MLYRIASLFRHFFQIENQSIAESRDQAKEDFLLVFEMIINGRLCNSGLLCNFLKRSLFITIPIKNIGGDLQDLVFSLLSIEPVSLMDQNRVSPLLFLLFV